MLTCQGVAECASDHLDHALTLRQRLAVEFHLSLCSNCRAYMAQLRATVGLAREAAATPPVAAEDEAQLLKLFDATLLQKK
jgi:predicted anti-sigma-YlaC factor YlaD